MGLLAVFYAPEKVFAQLRDKRPWVLPLIATLVLSLVSSIVVINMIGLETIVKNQLESNRAAAEQLGPEKIAEAAREAGSSPVRKLLTYVMAVVGTGMMLLIMSGVLLGVLYIFDAATPYGKVLAVCSYSYFAYALVTGVMSVIILMVLADYSGLDMNGLVMLNPGIFFDKATTARPLYSLLSSLDLLTFWAIFLVALGLSKTAPKLPLRRALMVVIIPWMAYVAAKAGLAMVF